MSAPQREAQLTPPPAPTVATPAAVLLVEADLAAANALQSVVASASEHCAWVLHESSLAAARRLLAACHFRLILLDPVLPDASPGQALRAIKRAAPATALVLVWGRGTALAEMECDLRPEAARLAGAVAVLRRDEEAELARLVRQVLGLSIRTVE